MTATTIDRTDIRAICEALRAGYRVAVHAQFFPYQSTTPDKPGTVHAVVDNAAQAVFCSREFFETIGSLPVKSE